MTLVLASGSTSCAQLLRAAGIAFEVHPAHVDETEAKRALLADGMEARGVADALAELKALRVSASYPHAIVLGADQVLAFEGALLSKCESLGEAAGLLRRLRGKTHELITAAVLAKNGAVIWRHAARARMTVRNFSDAFLADYLAEAGDAVLGAVGCYHLEGRVVQLFERVEGDYFSILGLPLVPLLAAFRTEGVIGT